jgi:Ca-activated chloride channel homolog
MLRLSRVLIVAVLGVWCAGGPPARAGATGAQSEPPAQEGVAPAQGSPALRIVSPTAETYLSGAVRLVAMTDPPSAVREVVSVTFFADSSLVCTVRRPPFECNWDAGPGVNEHQIRATATLRSGRRLVATVRTRGVQVVESVDVDVVQVTAVVTDSDGRFVRGLTRDDFKVFDDNRPQPITHFASEDIPLELVTAIDVSSSMRDALEQVKAAARRFLDEIEERDQVTVLAFNENIFTLARRTSDKTLRAKAIDRMAPWGGTALYDVIVKAIDILGRQSGRRAIMLFSDGDDQSSHATLAAAMSAAEGSDATIYAVGQGRAVDTPTLQSLMRKLASGSGGRAFFSVDPGKLDEIFSEILADLRNQYLLSYPAPEDVRNGAWHNIRVEVAGGRHQVRARQGYRLTRQ